jgi:lysozyme
VTNANLRVGPVALALIHHFEQCRLTAYRDSAGVPTIGWGSTYYADGSRVKMGDRITQDQADDLFALILERDFAGPVRKAIGDATTTPAQFGAMCALAYNIGMGPLLYLPGRKKGFRQSEVLRQHRGGKYAEASAAFQGWIRASGSVSNGLIRRRKAEAALYRSDFDALADLTHNEVRA